MNARGRRGALVLGTALVGACVTRTQRIRAAERATARGKTESMQDLAREALLLDAAANRAADTLYAPEAVVVANARVRLGAPRFAGIGYGGRVTVSAASVTLEGRWAWVLADYRWINAQQNQAEAGRATFVCKQKPRGWKIVHVHSSQLLPWDR